MKKYVDGVLVDLTAEEIADFNKRLAEAPSKFDMALEDLRVNRNRLLKETDFYALSDVTMSSEMETYRQELRDITEGLTTVEDVEAVVFPTKP
jgi:hypothetical protein|tara:strand:+ start:612 stop:890 length:279 start_codon:yes stop_codon:yes gene_type:complete